MPCPCAFFAATYSAVCAGKWSRAQGVGQNALAAVLNPSPLFALAPLRLWFPHTVGVSHHEYPVPDVGRFDSASRYNGLPCGVAEGFQVRKDIVEAQRFEPNNVLAKHPSGPDSLNDSAHFRPEPAVISLALSSPGERHWLAGESSANKVNWIESACIKVMDVSVLLDIRPVFSQDGPSIFVFLALPVALHPGPLQAEIEAADA